jgi:hypothetical protein
MRTKNILSALAIGAMLLGSGVAYAQTSRARAAAVLVVPTPAWAVLIPQADQAAPQVLQTLRVELSALRLPQAHQTPAPEVMP